MSVPVGHRCKPKISRVEVACQTDAPFSGNNNNNGTTPTVSQTRCNNLGISGTGKVIEQPAEQLNSSNKNGQVVPKEINATGVSGVNTSVNDESGEGTLVLCINGFSKMSDTICSPNQRIRGVPWRIMVMPKQHMVQKKSQKCMGFFLQCCPDRTYSDAWSCKADAEMRLLAVKGATNFVRKTSHVYTAKENDWGYSCFMTWADVLDESQGYIQNDHVTLEITVKADWPKNMMTRADFCKSIDQWYNLAEMQMSRGLVDLSIEANAQALKFCKDKDLEMKEKLEKQKERLVKKKVLDSINRIENKSETPKPVEPLKPTSLRQALTGAQKTIAAKGGSKTTGKKDKRTAMQQLKKKKAEILNKEKDLKKRVETQEWNEELSLHSSSDDVVKTPLTNSPPISPKDDAPKADEPPTKFGRKRPSDDCLSTTGCVGEDCSSDLSDDYQEDDSIQGMCEQCATGQCDSISSSEEAMVAISVTEHGCQTEDNTDQIIVNNVVAPLPQPNPRRERRFAGQSSGSQPALVQKLISEQMSRIGQATDEVLEKIYATPDEKAEQIEKQRLAKFFSEVFGVDNLADLIKDLEIVLSSDNENPTISSLSSNIFNKLDNLSDDHGTCCLAAGLCTVQSRRILQIAMDFCRTVAYLYTDEIEQVIANMIDKGTSAIDKSSPKQNSQQAPVNIHGRKLATAVRRHNTSATVPYDLTIRISDTDEPLPLESNSQIPLEGNSQIANAEICLPPTLVGDFPLDMEEDDCEKNIKSLLADVGSCQVDDLINQKISQMEMSGDDSALLAILQQLFEYSQALSNSGDRMEEMLEAARKMQVYHQSSNGIRAAEAMRKNQEKVSELEKNYQKVEAELRKKEEQLKKLQSQFQAEESKYKAEHEKVEQGQVHLRDVRNQLKKLEKKAKNEENRNAILQAEKIEYEDKIKNFKKEIEALKKKNVEDRAKAKKEKERDAELIRRTETEALEKENERERERQSYEEKIQAAKSREQKLEKEKKTLSASLSAMTDRVRVAEIGQLDLIMNFGMNSLNKCKDDCHVGLSEAEDNLKRARTHADMETMKKSLLEWRAACDDVDRLISSAKTEYEGALDCISKGTKTLCQCEFKMPMPPALPKIVRVPPVQVVQPSTSVIAPPNIAPPPAGVIGQQRTPQIGRLPPGVNIRDVHSPTTSSSASNALFAGPPSPPPSQRKGSGSIRTDEPTTLSAPAPSPWSWSTPLGNLSDMIRPVAEAHSHNQDLWSSSDTPNPAQMRSMYPTPGGWMNGSPQGNWRQNQPRAPGMPFYDS